METLFVSDLDGTLLGRDAMLSARSRAVLLELLARDVCFTVASARSVISMQGVLGPLPLRLPVIGFNGGFVSDLATGRHLRVLSIEPEIARLTHDRARSAGLPVTVSTHTAEGDRMYVPATHNGGIALYVADRQRHRDPRLRLVDDPAVGLGQTVTCLTIIDRRPAVEAFASALPAAARARLQLHLTDDMYTPGWAWLTAHAADATKGRALQGVMADASLSERQLVVFGDELNDLAMFEVADHAVATENAHPEVKHAADEVIGHHHDDAVVDWLQHHS